MSLVDLWDSDLTQIKDKHIQQLLAFSGEGKLNDNSVCSIELRKLLSIIPSDFLKKYSEQCLTKSFPDSGFVLQDIVNQVGVRLGAEVSHGLYQGTKTSIGYDGIWQFGDHFIVIEVKTTDAYRINLDKLAKYRKAVLEEKQIKEDHSSILLIVGRQDTGDLEAQIRGSRHAWDTRIISVESLIRLMFIKEQIEDPAIMQKIRSVLIPREFTRLDAIVELLFSTAEEIKTVTADKEFSDSTELEKDGGTKTKSLALHEQCIARLEKQFKQPLIKQSRSRYATADNSIIVSCAVSREYDSDKKPGYWFAFHSYHADYLKNANNSFAVFGCGNSGILVIIPYKELEPILPTLWKTERKAGFYYHVSIQKEGDKMLIKRVKGHPKIDITKYLVYDH